jgi:putative spermidine/putrescine transport system ATP-binding protein
VTALVRPESVGVVPDPDGRARVLSTAFLGPTSRVTVEVGDSVVVAQVSGESLAELPAGTPVRIDLRPVPVALQD